MTTIGHSSLPPPPPPPRHAARANFGNATWGLGDAFATFGIFVATSVVISFIALAASGGFTEAEVSTGWLPLLIAGPAIASGLYVVHVGRHKGNGAATDFRFTFERIDLAIGAGLALLGLITAGLAALATEALAGDTPDAAVAEALDPGDGGTITWSALLVLVMVPTIAPLFEELVYRGLWWSALAKRGVSELGALAVTSIVFAAAHFEPVRFFVLMVLGFALGLGRYFTGRVGPSVVAHFFVNLLAAVALWGELAVLS